MKIRQYRPAFFEGFENETCEFSTLEEMKYIPWVKGFTEIKNFHRFSYSDNHLMAEYREGKEWWVVGTLSEIPEGLKKWEPIYLETSPDQAIG